MVVRIRLSRLGCKNRPYYRVMAADSRCPRDGKFLEILGYYNPLPGQDGGKRMGLNFDRVKYWLSVGAQPSDPVQRVLFRAGLLPPPPMLAMTRKGGPRDRRPIDPMTGRYLMPKSDEVVDQPEIAGDGGEEGGPRVSACLEQTSKKIRKIRVMAILKVFGQPASVCTARVSACLEELGLDYELVPINFPTGEHKKQPYLSKNPFGQVPAFEDGDLVLFESRAITRYAAHKYKGKGTDLLKEHNTEQSTLVDVWMEVESQQYNPAIGPIVMQSVIIPKYGGVPDEKLIASSVEKLEKVLNVYEERLSTNKYLAGNFFSLADLHHLPLTYYLVQLTNYASLITSRPHVKAWWEDISSRPASKNVTANMFSK